MKKPELQEIITYFETNGSTKLEARKFLMYYISVAWTVGKNKPMKSWKGCAGGWILREPNFDTKKDDNVFSEANIRDRMEKW